MAARATAMEISDQMIDGSRRLFVVAATIAAILGVLGGAAEVGASVTAQAPAFRWLQPQPPPPGWKLARLPSGAATFAYPKTWRHCFGHERLRLSCSATGAASVAIST